MKNEALVNGAAHPPMAELTAYHQKLLAKYKDIAPTEVKPDPDTKAILAFNGYYTLTTANGAFLAIDTNMLVSDNLSTPNYVVDLLISLDGTTSARLPFTGTFDGTHLVEKSSENGGVDINLTFVHTDGSDGTTATCSGTIALGNKSAVNVSGSTYNNPIPSSLFIGDYYETLPNNTVPVKVMSIGANYQLLYDNGSNSGVLQPITTYAYNINMYFFSLTETNGDSVSLIMGTAASKGFACNNMIVNKSVTPNTVTVRSLLTIPGGVMAPFEVYDISGSKLAGFSGYYQIPEIAPLAFITIQAQYTTVSELLDWDLNFVMISISLDGITCNGYYFDPLKMTFKNNTLIMPDQGISIIFNREYNADNGSLVTINALIAGKLVTGYTLFNPVPLPVFGGVTMTDAKKDTTLTITNNNQVTYNTTVMDKILYVPLMYILAYPITNTNVVMSFGTDGLSGNTCIITDYTSGTAVTYVVYAIPNAQ